LKIKRLSAAHAVAEVLRAQITSGELAPQARLIEADLADGLSVSRTPLREALKQLEAEGFVDRLPGGGLVVTDIDPEDVSDLFWLRAVIEKAVVEEVTRTVTPEELDRLDRMVDQMILLREHPERFLELGRDFHDALAGLLGNQRCRTILRQVRSHVDRYWAVTTARRPERTSYAANQHRQILNLMRQGDAEAAGAKMSEHVLAEAEVCLETVRAIHAEVGHSRGLARAREVAG
jgi:DNA-binding GntR family transcriptional regulator